MPQPKDMYADKQLTNVSVKFSNRLNEMGFLADKIFPIVNVDKDTGIYFEFDKANLRVPSNTKRTGRARASEVDYDIIERTYGPLDDHAVEHFISRRVLDNYDQPLEPRSNAVEMLTEVMQLEKEEALATTLSDTAVLTQNTTLSGTAQFSDYTNSDPFLKIQTGIDAVNLNSLRMPNTMFMGYEVWSKLMNHPDLIERIKYQGLGMVTKETFLKLFSDSGITNLWVGNTKKNSAKEGQADSLGYVWGKHLWLAYVEPNAKLEAPTLGYTLSRRNGREVERWPEAGVKGEFVSVADYYQQKTISATAAYLIKNAIA